MIRCFSRGHAGQEKHGAVTHMQGAKRPKEPKDLMTRQVGVCVCGVFV